MTTLTSSTTFTIQAALETITETADISLLAENSGGANARELRYPGNALAPLIYEEPPDAWENFDTAPLTARPLVKGQMTIADYQIARWPGYTKDNPVREIWKGSETIARMPLSFLRRLWEYYANPPTSGYITWNPKDRADKAYNIEITGLKAGSASGEAISFNSIAAANGYVLGEVIFSFIIVGEA